MEDKKVNVLARDPAEPGNCGPTRKPECFMANAERRARCHCDVFSARDAALSGRRARDAQPHPVVHQELLLRFDLRGQLREVRVERVTSLAYLEQLG